MSNLGILINPKIIGLRLTWSKKDLDANNLNFGNLKMGPIIWEHGLNWSKAFDGMNRCSR